MSGYRLKSGGARIDRERTLSFNFEGRRYWGFAGDTLASALLANGVSIVGRSFKYHRPRGVFAAGAEEPNALIQLERGAHATANVPATQIELYEGLQARAVNCWPDVDFDLGEVNNLLARFFPAGFYYKAFIWPNWEFYEPLIRRAAGLGRVSSQADPDCYETQFAHCDVLVIGAGAAGLAAARAASSAGARVMLAEQEPVLGGTLRWRDGEIDAGPARAWAAKVESELRAAPNARVLTRTCAMGYFDHNEIVLLEAVSEHLGRERPAASVRQRLWQVRARQVILACGALERPIVFAGNDRPGVMLASAVAQYAGDFGVGCGREAVFFTNNDSAYACAEAYLAAGGRIVAIVDTRAQKGEAAARLAAHNIPVLAGAHIVSTQGKRALSGIRVRTANGENRAISADLLAVSGGWTPTLHLHCQSGGVPRWDEAIASLVPGASVQNELSAGACAGAFSLSEALGQGAAAGVKAAQAAGFANQGPSSAPTANATISFAIEPVWRIEGDGKAFVDLQNDVTADDIALAARENFVSVEHLKRYTTLGMGTDQGKTSNVNALALMSELRGQSTAQSGVTRYRFPYKPVSLGAFAGVNRGELFRPRRRLRLHDWHEAHGAVFEEYGSWMRPAYYPRPGESPHDAEQREALAVRTGVGIFDGSPLGKIEVIGPDAGAFVDRVYANRMSDLKPGRCRYGLMLNELGVVIDDGVCARLGEDRFLVGTTSGGAARIAAWLEEWLQCEWVNFEVVTAPVTQSWNVVTLTGPKARALLQKIGVDFDVSAEAFPHLSWRAGKAAGIEARVFRVSYTGEVSYELNVAPARMEELWRICVEAGAEFGIAPIGIDAWMLLRTERGFLHVGADTDGTTTALDVGWARVLKRKGDFIGRRSLLRPADQRPDRLNFVGIEPVDANIAIRVGLPVLSEGVKKTGGYVTSAGFSPILQRFVGLGMIDNGRARIGELITLAGPDGAIAARITEPGAFDPKGERVNG
jgi:sarcosine oxidase subunit alpha